MSTPYLHGKFVWFELLTQDIDRAIQFYDRLFGWRSARTPMGTGEPYPLINNGDQAIGGYRKGPTGVANHWVPYLSVPDVDTAHRAAMSAGCRITMPPTDFSPVGRAAAIADPTGAPFCVWKGANGDPLDVENTPMGGWFWNELWTNNDRRALEFYESMFGFKHEVMSMGQTPYYVLKNGGRPRAGLCQSVNSEARSMWLPYVAVPDCNKTAAKAIALGGEVVTSPRDIPGIGRFGVAVDTTGAAVAFITPANR